MTRRLISVAPETTGAPVPSRRCCKRIMTKELQATDEKPAMPGPTVSDTITSSSTPVVGPTLSPDFTDDEDHIALYLNGRWFALIWWTTMVSHMLCVIFLGSCTAMYIFISQPEMIYYNKLLGSDLRNQMKEYGYIFVAMGGLHFLEMLKMIWCSLRSRRLEFRIPKKPTKIKPVVPPSAAATATKTGDDPATKPESPVIKRLRQISKRQMLPKRLSHGLRRFGRVLLRWKVRLFDRKQGFFGIESPYFNVVFLLREGVEIASQSYQMYQCSALISRQWINVLFLAITVCNCWSTPILQHALARYNALERSICLSIDGIMDAGTCMVIPTIIVLKYVRAFDRELVGFPEEYLNDPEWFVDMILENRMLYAMSKTDLFSTIVPHYSLFGCVRKVKNLIHRMAPEMEAAHVQYINYAENNDPNATKMRVSSLHRGSGKLPGWRRRFVHFFFVSWGLAVLVTHLRARQVAKRYADITACSQQLRPWYSNSFVCSTYEFDCAAQGHVDTINASDLALVDSESLSALIISNCPALEMPTEIQQFYSILKFMVYNSSIVSWTTNASINAVSHPSIISICVLLCNVTSFPDGLLDNFPQALQDVQFAQTNLTTLPTDLDQKWQPVTKIFFEDCSFTDFPPALANLKVDELSIAGNLMTTLPDVFNVTTSSSTATGSGNSGTMGIPEFNFNNNPDLHAFPASGMKTPLRVVSIENTAFSELPAWINSTDMTGPWGGLAIYANNTPLCQAMNGVSPDDLRYTSTLIASATSTLVFCSQRDPNGLRRVPMDALIARFRPSA